MTIKHWFFIVTITLVFSACFSPWQDDKGTFSVSIGGGNNRAVALVGGNEYTIENLLHIITLTGPGTGQETRIIGAKTVSFTVDPGRWHISVKAYNPSDFEQYSIEDMPIEGMEPVAAGSADINVKAGKNNPVIIPMGQPEGPEPNPSTFTVTFMLNYDDAVYETLEVIADTPILRIPSLNREGFIFGGWYTDSECTDKNKWQENTPVTDNIILWAKWTAKEQPPVPPSTFTVTFMLNNGTDETYQKCDVEKDQSIPQIDDPTRQGYQFGGWYKDSGCTNENKWEGDTPITNNTTLYAKWNPTTGTAKITIIHWKDEADGTNGVDGTIVKDDKAGGFTATVNWDGVDENSTILWYLWGIPIAGNENGSITISAEDYNPGTYQLMVMVYKDDIPYSAEISFTVQ